MALNSFSPLILLSSQAGINFHIWHSVDYPLFPLRYHIFTTLLPYACHTLYTNYKTHFTYTIYTLTKQIPSQIPTHPQTVLDRPYFFHNNPPPTPLTTLSNRKHDNPYSLTIPRPHSPPCFPLPFPWFLSSPFHSIRRHFSPPNILFVRCSPHHA